MSYSVVRNVIKKWGEKLEALGKVVGKQDALAGEFKELAAIWAGGRYDRRYGKAPQGGWWLYEGRGGLREEEEGHRGADRGSGDGVRNEK
jgi:hypothetical protein